MFLGLYHTCTSGTSQHGFDIRTFLGFILLSPNPDVEQLFSAVLVFFLMPRRHLNAVVGKQIPPNSSGLSESTVNPSEDLAW